MCPEYGLHIYSNYIIVTYLIVVAIRFNFPDALKLVELIT